MLNSRIACGLLAILCSSLAHVEAAEPAAVASSERRVELFTAMADGQIDVELTTPSAREIWLRVANKTDDLLRIDLPDAFAAVPVLGQLAPAGNIGLPNGFGMPGMGAQNNLGAGANLGNFGNPQAGLGQGGQGTQGLGGGFNNGVNAVGNIGGGNPFGNGIGNGIGNPGGNRGPFQPGMFRVPAGRVGKAHAMTVCLEHGKPEPNSRLRYRIVPLEQFNSDPRIAQVCQQLASRQITQNVAQAAAWHIANQMPWEVLAAKERVRSKYTGNQKFFSDKELELARQVVAASQEAVPSTAALTLYK